MKMNRAIWVCGMGLILAMTSGCAFGTRHAKVTYPPASVTAKSSTNAPAAGVTGRIALEPFDDVRADKQIVGHVRNGFGMKTADVVCDDQDIAALVNTALRGELQKAGYEVLEAGSPAAGDAPVLGGSLTTLYCDAYMNYDGSATLVVHLSRAGNVVFKKTYEGKGSSGMNWAATGSGYGDSLSLAVVDVIAVMMRDLPTALRQ